jgi:hypothetical protein
MERPPMFMDWQNLDSENGFTAESNLQIQWNIDQNSNVILHRNRKINPKIHLEAQKTLNSQRNPEQIEKSLFPMVNHDTLNSVSCLLK